MKVVLNTLAAYSDERGNSISVGSGGSVVKSTVTFNENGSKLVVGRNVKFSVCSIELGKNATLIIGDDSKIRGTISVGFGSSVIIGSDVTFVSNMKVRAVESTSITIGNDCLFAAGVTIRTNDGHPIYDAYTRERINSSKSVVVGEHVWLGEDVVVLKGVEIGAASIVAGRSVVTKNIPKNSVAAGAPAKVVRTGVTWEHNSQTFSPQYYLQEEV
ncbi:Galactoside O-acetyltransferase [compost metagenome]